MSAAEEVPDESPTPRHGWRMIEPMEFLTTPEVAARLRLTPDTVRRMCAAQTITATKVGRQWLVSEEDFAGFVARYRGRKVPPTRVDRVKRGHRRVG
jgi:excisionase family DNA binding protein